MSKNNRQWPQKSQKPQKLKKISSDFPGFLKDELKSRIERNSKYSLRAFARALRTDPSELSKIMTGKRIAGPRVIRKWGARLAVNQDLISAWLLSEREKAWDRQRTTPAGVDPEYRTLSADIFKQMADWYHFAIIQLFYVDDFEATPVWVAERLGIPVSTARSAIARLDRLGLIEIRSDGKWLDRCAGTLTNVASEVSSQARRKLQRQVLQKAMAALDQIPIDERDQSSHTVAINSSRLPEAKEKIKVFRRSLARFLSEGTSRDRVYHFSVSLYPVSDKA